MAAAVDTGRPAPSGRVRLAAASRPAAGGTRSVSVSQAPEARPLPERQARGREAERAVAQYLRAHGFRIVARNLRLGALEIDLVAQREHLVVVVEVRTRGPGAWTRPMGSLGAAKRTRIRRAGERLWRKQLRRDRGVRCLRFDAAGVHFGSRGPEIDYVSAAF